MVSLRKVEIKVLMINLIWMVFDSVVCWNLFRLKLCVRFGKIVVDMN